MLHPIEFTQGLQLEPGNYVIEISADGYETLRKEVELGAVEDKRLSVPLTRIMAPITGPAPQPKQTEAPATEPVQPPPPLQALPEKAFTNSLGMTFVLIPAGTFLMGAPSAPRNVKRYGGEVAW